MEGKDVNTFHKRQTLVCCFFTKHKFAIYDQYHKGHKFYQYYGISTNTTQ